MIAAKGGDEYVGDLKVYIMGSGEFQYSIRQNGAGSGDTTMFDDVLKGLQIKAAKIQ